MRFTYIALAIFVSLYLCFAVGNSTPPNIPATLVMASRVLALICLASCGIAIRSWKMAAAVIIPSFFIYVGLAMTQRDHGHELIFVVKGTATIAACLGAAAHEDKEEEANDKDVPQVL